MQTPLDKAISKINYELIKRTVSKDSASISPTREDLFTSRCVNRTQVK